VLKLFLLINKNACKINERALTHQLDVGVLFYLFFHHSIVLQPSNHIIES